MIVSDQKSFSKIEYKLIAAVSQDGFIAKYSGHLPAHWTSVEEQKKFQNDIKDCEWSVMGRKTHELALNNNKKRIIFTRTVNTYKFVNDNHIFFNPKKISFNKIIDLIKPVSTICILGGTNVYDYFYERKQINKLIITVEPINFGFGLSLFSKVSWKNFPNMFINKGYKLDREIQIINNNKTKYYFFSIN